MANPNKNRRIYQDPTYANHKPLECPDPKPMGQGLLFSDELDYGYLKRFPFATGGTVSGRANIGDFLKFTLPLIRPVQANLVHNLIDGLK